MTKKITHDSPHVRGFFRLHIKEDGKIVGDSGWVENQITNYGYETCIVGPVGAIAGSTRVTTFALGTGTVVASNSSALPGELSDASNCRISALTPTAVSSKTLRFVGSLNSNIVTATRAIANIGMFATSSTVTGSCIAGNTYTTSTLATNQTVDATYELRFA